MKVWLSAVAVLLVAGSSIAQTTSSVVVVGTNATANSIYNTPQLLLDAGGRRWAEVVNNLGTNNLVVDDKLPVWVTSTVNGVTYTNWSGTILYPGGSYLIRPFGMQGVNAAGNQVWGVLIGVGTNVVGTREDKR